MPQPLRPRVACYVVRPNGDRADLLVFDHLDPGTESAGVQVPAGGIESGETVAEAAARELYEETGLTGATYVGVIGAHEFGGNHVTFVRFDAPAGGPDGWRHLVRSGDLDDRMTFGCRFTPLPLTEALADAQDAFVNRLGSTKA